MILCLIGVFSLVATTGLLDYKPSINILTMFTTISNILCVLYFFVDFLYLCTNNKKSTWNHYIKGIVINATSLTFLIAQFMLHMTFNFNSYIDLSFLGLHYVVPIMALLDWLLFDPKGQIKLLAPFTWLILPVFYFITAIICAYTGHGLGVSATSKYPYPFMDISVLGVSTVFTTAVIMIIFFLIIGYLFYLLDHFLAKKIK